MSISVELGKKEIERLLKELKVAGLCQVPTRSGHERLRIKDSDTSIVLYHSGKVVHNDTRIAREIIKKAVSSKEGYSYLLGTDEAGKGEWYGPLVVVCVAAKPEEESELRSLGVRDSKTIPKRSLLALAEKIRSFGLREKTLVLMPETYNRMYREFQKEGKSLNDLLAWAHSRVIKDMLSSMEHKKVKVVIDRFDEVKTQLRLSGIDPEIEVLQKARAEKETPVAAASILAKYAFEKRVDGLDSQFDLELRKTKPSMIKKDVLPKVAKLHFKNVP